jgi:L-alanine-DL-glutamate epimerase-like enolase superfamily enzyme
VNQRPEDGVVRIRSIEAVGLGGATPPGGWSAELQPEDVVHTLVFVHTDEDLVGVGSVSSTNDLVRAALRVLEPLYRGESALEPDRVSEKLRQHSFWLGHGGSITHTISGIDIALWDIAGHALGQPVGRLLGGRFRDRVMPYASVLMDEPARMTDELSALRQQGFRAFKVGWGPFGRVDARTDTRLVEAARAAVGPDALLAIDAGASDAFWRADLSWAVRSADLLADHQVAWFEEALPPDAVADFAQLRQRSRVAISGGEVLTRRQAFRPYFEAGSFDIVQPDVTKVGGLGEARRIGWAAEDRDLRLVPHGWNTAVGLAADLQLASALARTDLVEYRTGAAYIDELPTTPWELDGDGMLAIPDVPGLGLEIDKDALTRYGVS